MRLWNAWFGVKGARARFESAPINIAAEATTATRKLREIGCAAMSNAPEMQTRTLTRCIILIATQLRTAL